MGTSICLQCKFGIQSRCLQRIGIRRDFQQRSPILLDKQDIVADVVTRMWRAQESYDPTKGEEFTWIWTIAKNAVNDAANDKRKRENIGGCWDDDADEQAKGMLSDDSADSELLRDEFVEELHNRLRQERDKRILLYLAQDLDYEEIAEREGLTKQAAYMAVFHVRQRLDNHAA